MTRTETIRTKGVRVWVPCLPVAQPRQRISLAGGKPRAYLRAKHPVHGFKAIVRLAVAQQWEGPPLDGPVCVRLTAILPRPKAMCWKRRPTPEVAHAKKPDLDNLTKAVLDSLSGLCWRDDAQVSRLLAAKRIAAGDGQSGVEIEVREDE